jgi:hypothetical protein
MLKTVIGHLYHWFDLETIDARERWHLISRLARKLLGRTVLSFLNRTHHRPALQFADLIRD